MVKYQITYLSKRQDVFSPNQSLINLQQFIRSNCHKKLAIILSSGVRNAHSYPVITTGSPAQDKGKREVSSISNTPRESPSPPHIKKCILLILVVVGMRREKGFPRMTTQRHPTSFVVLVVQKEKKTLTVSVMTKSSHTISKALMQPQLFGNS